MGDMTNDFITLTARATQLEGELKSRDEAIAEYKKRIDGLIIMRNDLQKANSDYLEQARKNREADRIVIEGWQNEAMEWAKKFATLRQDIEKYERDVSVWVRGMRGYGRLGLLLDCLMAVIFFATFFGFMEPIFNLRWW